MVAVAILPRLFWQNTTTREPENSEISDFLADFCIGGGGGVGWGGGLQKMPVHHPDFQPVGGMQG